MESKQKQIAIAIFDVRQQFCHVFNAIDLGHKSYFIKHLEWLYRPAQHLRLQSHPLVVH